MLNCMKTIIGYLCNSLYYQEQLILYSHTAVYIIHILHLARATVVCVNGQREIIACPGPDHRISVRYVL